MKQLSGALLSILVLAGGCDLPSPPISPPISIPISPPISPPKPTIPKLDISVVSADVDHNFLTFYLGLRILNLEGAKAINLEYTVVVADIDDHAISHILQSGSVLPASVDAEDSTWALYEGKTLELPYHYGVMLEWEDEGGNPYSWATVGDFTFGP